jgi:D-alanine-D-alanine ligase
MRKKLHIAVVYNKPVVDPEDERKFVSESGTLEVGATPGRQPFAASVDLSEVGVLEEREDISRALAARGYKTSIFSVDGDIVPLIDFLRQEKPDLVFNLCEGIENEAIHEMHAVGIYELLGVHYTGSDPLTLGTALNKVRVKEILSYHGLPTPRFQLVKSPVRVNIDPGMRFPMIVKPSREDASIGIETASVVSGPAELKKRIRHVVEEHDQPALVEEYIDGRELNVGILGNRKPIVFPISEIDMSTLPKQYHRIITYNAKWMKGTDEYEHTRGICPAPLPLSLETTIKEMALKAYQVLGCRDYARVDFRLSKENKPYILEVNPNPDISDDAGFARSARVYGYDFDELAGKIVECALERMP